MRYYQRPDATHLTLDTLARSLGGITGELTLNKEAGRHWRGELGYWTTSPGFETNDLGFQTRADEHTGRVNVEYVEEQPGRIFREWNIETQPRRHVELRSRPDRHGPRGPDRRSVAQLLGDRNSLNRSFASLDDRLTRGGPLTASPASTSLGLNLESDSRKAWTIGLSADRSDRSRGNAAPRWN